MGDDGRAYKTMEDLDSKEPMLAWQWVFNNNKWEWKLEETHPIAEGFHSYRIAYTDEVGSSLEALYRQYSGNRPQHDASNDDEDESGCWSQINGNKEHKVTKSGGLTKVGRC